MASKAKTTRKRGARKQAAESEPPACVYPRLRPRDPGFTAALTGDVTYVRPPSLVQKVLDLAREEKRRVRRVDELAHAEAAQLAPQLARADVNRQLQIDRAKRNTGPREPRSELSERLIGFLNEHKRYLMGPSKDAMIAFEQSRHGVEVRNVETLRKALLRARKKILGQLAASCPTEVVPMTNGPRSTTRNPTT